MNRLLRRLSVVVLLAVFLVTCVGAAEISPSDQSVRENFIKGNTSFGVQLYHQLAFGKKGNIFFSAYSISSAMGMTYAGARGKTAQEMKEALHFNLEQAELHPAFKRLNEELVGTAKKTGQKLDIANALVLTGGDVSSAFKTILKDYYDAEMFGGGLEQINCWVKRKTENKIEKILEELSPNTVCVILNAIYFKGIWESQFEKSRTHDAPFKLTPGSEVTVPLMNQESKFKIMCEKDFQAVSLPYKSNHLSMVIFLPNKVDGLTALEQKLTTPSLKEWLSALDGQTLQKVNIYLPKFKLNTGYNLVPPFGKMGMKDAFGNGADFTGMGWAKGDLWISQIVHKAFVEVNEEGTEAAAATGVEMATKSFLPASPVFRVDHPCIFLIRDNASGTILFMGRMVNPQG